LWNEHSRNGSNAAGPHCGDKCNITHSRTADEIVRFRRRFPANRPIIPASPSMFAESTVERLSACTYRDDAKRVINYIPFSGIHWDDEMPRSESWSKFAGDDYRRIVHLFALRSRMWRGEALSEDDQQFWDVARSVVPGWALFRRTTVSQADRETDDEVYTYVTKMMDEFLAEEENVSVTETEGVQRYSVIWDVPKKAAKEAPSLASGKPWWKRAFHK
jgi:hypothetical protein